MVGKDQKRQVQAPFRDQQGVLLQNRLTGFAAIPAPGMGHGCAPWRWEDWIDRVALIANPVMLFKKGHRASRVSYVNPVSSHNCPANAWCSSPRLEIALGVPDRQIAVAFADGFHMLDFRIGHLAHHLAGDAHHQ